MFYLTTHSTHFIYGYMEGKKEMFYLMMHSTHFIYGYMEGRKEMFYLTTHSTHFIYGYMASERRKEGNVLFNDTLNTFYLRLYGVGLSTKCLFIIFISLITVLIHVYYKGKISASSLKLYS